MSLTKAPQSLQTVLFAGTALAGAALLFWVQPLFTKMALPLLGGSPSVWNTAMVFFQTMLLAAYAYVHGLTRWLAPRGQLAVHSALLGAAALALPLGIAEGWLPEAGLPPAAWLLLLLAASLGAPFFAVAATAPLLQRWFSLGSHPQAADPYFLYAASNAGSVAALLAFPFVLEPLLNTGTQSMAWTFGYLLLALCLLACGASIVRSKPQSMPDRAAPSAATPAAAVGWRQRAGWTAYSALPSGLLLGVTAHISTDIASSPLLWTVPLALYLLTFVNAFARRPLASRQPAARAMAFAIVLLAAVFPFREPAGIFLPLHLGAFFCIALACHAELAARRPPAGALTEFYLFLSLGGLLGGVLVVLAAPLAFDAVLEYPLCLALAAALLPRRSAAANQPAPQPGAKSAAALTRSDLALAAAVAALALGAKALVNGLGVSFPAIAQFGLLGLLAVLTLSRQLRPPAFALCVGGLLLSAHQPMWSDGAVWTGRSFFGVYRVKESAQPPTRYLAHGTTNHGGQWMPRPGVVKPTTYHTPSSPAAEVVRRLRARSPALRVGVAGVGTGAMAYHRQPGDWWRYYEIDPLVAWLATDSGYFEMMPRHDPDASIVLGDARLALAGEPDGQFDLLLMDAFSSDAVPIHLLTQEAMSLYMAKLRGDGILLLHISNRLLHLAPPVAGNVAKLGLAARTGSLGQVDEAADPTAAPSQWVAVAREDATLEALGLGPRWTSLDGAGQSGWRDDFSNLAGAVRWLGALRDGG